MNLAYQGNNGIGNAVGAVISPSDDSHIFYILLVLNFGNCLVYLNVEVLIFCGVEGGPSDAVVSHVADLQFFGCHIAPYRAFGDRIDTVAVTEAQHNGRGVD